MQRTNLDRLQVQRGIGIAAASTLIDQKLLRSGLHRFAKWRVPTLVDPRIFSRHLSFAGTDEQRAKVISSLVESSEIGTLWCARGGYGSTRILPYLDSLRVAIKMR